MSQRLPQRTGQFSQPPAGWLVARLLAHRQLSQSAEHPEHTGSAAVGFPVKNGQRPQSHPGAGAS